MTGRNIERNLRRIERKNERKNLRNLKYGRAMAHSGG
jgi:hypothetical protein